MIQDCAVQRRPHTDLDVEGKFDVLQGHLLDMGVGHRRGNKILDKFVSLGGEKANADEVDKALDPPSFPQKLQKTMHTASTGCLIRTGG